MALMHNPVCSATYDDTADRVVVMFRDGRDVSVAAYDPKHIPGVINLLMEARRRSKAAKAAVPLPPPMRPPLALRTRRSIR